ncbi:RecE family exodeoxyribonuclease [Citrobacter amalonaticus]|nr:RecE family exodeoxyribonuclease [Citrobacter amalonaticus]MDT7074180.1 RecE family exodeoxyribonuclease [Citrobacter amalonaticus]
MSGTNPVFLVRKAKKLSGQKDAVLWCSDDFESANATLDYLLIKSGAKLKDYFKAVATNFPVVNELPPEGELSLTFCDFYQLGSDNMTWAQIPGVTLPSSEAVAAARQRIVDGVDTETGEVLEDHTEDFGNDNVAPLHLRPLARLRQSYRLIAHLTSDIEEKEISEARHIQIGEMVLDDNNLYVQHFLQAIGKVSAINDLSAHVEWKLMKAFKAAFNPAQVFSSSDFEEFITQWIANSVSSSPSKGSGEKANPSNYPELTTVPTMPFRHRVLAQHIGNSEYMYHVDTEQKKEIIRLEMDTDNSYIQNLLLAAESVEPFKKANEVDIWKAVNAIKTVFPVDGKIPELATVIQFLKVWFGTEHIDRGIITKEWAAGNRISKVPSAESTEKKEEQPPVREARYKRAVAQTIYNLNVESCVARLYPDAVPGLIKIEQLKAAKDLIDSRDDIQAKVIKVLSHINDILDYDAVSIFGVTRAIDWSNCLNIGPVVLRDQARNWLAENGIYVNGKKSNGYSEWSEDPRATRHEKEPSREETDRQLAAQRGEFVEGISDPNDPKWVKTESSPQTEQPELVKKVADGIFDVSALMQNSSTHGTKKDPETTSNVQVQETNGDEKQAGDALYAGESNLGNGEEADAGERAILNQSQAETHQNDDSVNHSEPEAQQNAPETQQEEPAPEWPSYFEPGRYEGVPNDVYHAANGISSTMVKDARVSLMYYDGRHVSKTIKKERSKVLDMGNLVHALALQPEILDEEFSIEPVIPEGALTTTATIREVIDDYNNGLPVQLSADDIKRFLEEYNATLPQPVPLGDDVTQTGESYMSLPPEFQRVEEGQKVTAAKMKACIREYNATLPAQMKTSGSRDTLLEQLAIINPDLVAQEAQKPQPLKVSGTKADLIQAVKSVKPDTVFADELLDAWRENPGDKILVTRQQYATALAIQSALYAHPEAGKLLQNPTRAVEVSYFGIDDDTGLEIRVRPDVELEYEGLRIGFDLKTISMWDVKEDALKSRLHREITMRDYHLSAGMYCNVADLDKFAWIFVNKDEGYHWVAVVWASESLLELGKLEYRQTIRSIANAMDTGEWPAPITEDYTDELNDYDLRRLDALREMA